MDFETSRNGVGRCRMRYTMVALELETSLKHSLEKRSRKGGMKMVEHASVTTIVQGGDGCVVNA